VTETAFILKVQKSVRKKIKKHLKDVGLLLDFDETDE